MLKYCTQRFGTLKRKSFLFKASIILLAAMLLTGGSLVYAQLVDNDVYRIAVDQRGNMRLLDPSLNGNFNDELKNNEFLIEVPSDMRVSELMSALEEQLITLGADISDLDSTMALLEEDIAMLQEEDNDTTVDISDLQTAISEINNRLNNHDSSIDDLWDSIDDLQEQIDTIEEQMSNDDNSGNGNSNDTDYIPLDNLVFAEKPYLGETAPTTLEDMSMSSNTCTIIGTTPTRLDSGLWVWEHNTENEEYIDTGLDYDLSGNGDFTVAIWSKQVTNSRYLISQAHTASYSSDWILALDSAANLFWMRSKNIPKPAGVSLTQWTHLTMVWHKSTETYEAFVNGVSVGTSATVSGYGGINTVKIGTRGDATSSFYDGYSSLTKIYTSALSAQEISDIYEAERHWFEP